MSSTCRTPFDERRSSRRTSILKVSAAGACILSAQALSAQQIDQAMPLPPDPAVITGVLDNGLRYFIRENSEPENRAALRLVIDAGSVLEEESQQGLAHFVEHMAFNGTENFEKQALVDYLESIGMRFGPNVNAYTSFDETVYMLLVPTDDPSAMETAMRILRDWAGAVSFDPEEVDKERGVIVEEWRGRLGAQQRIMNQQLPVLLEGSLHAERLPIGDIDVLENATAQDLRRFYEDWYRPDLMAIVAVGDFDQADIEARIKETFGGLEGPESPKERISPEIPVDLPPRTTIVTDPEAQQTQVGVIRKMVAESSLTVGDYRRGLIRQLYAGMMGLRFSEITQQPDAPFLFAGAGSGSFARGIDAFQLSAFVPEGGALKGLEAVLTEGERAARHGFSESELERQKTEILRQLQRRVAEKENQESAALASRYVNVFLEGTSYPAVEAEMALAQALLPNIAAEELAEFARSWSGERGRVVAVSAPEKDGSVPPSEDDLSQLFGAVDVAEIEPYDDGAVDEPLLPELPASGARVASEEVVEAVGVTIWTLENGLRVVLKPTDFKEDEIRFAASSPGGTSLASDEDYQPASIASQVVGASGVGGFDNVELQKKLAGKVVSVRPSIGSLFEAISGSASVEDIETAFQLIYLYFMEPRLDHAAFKAMTQQMAGVFANASADPNTAFADLVAETMSQGHPRSGGLLKQMEYLANVEPSDVDEAFAFYRERFQDAGDFSFYFVGAFEPSELRPLVERYLGALPGLGREESWRDVGIDPPSGVLERVLRKGMEPQGQTTIIFSGDASYSLSEWASVQALADVLDIRLREVVREDLGGTYGVRVSGSLTQRPDEEYQVRISFGSAPERTEELAQAVFDEIKRIQAEGPTDEVVEKVKEMDRRSMETALLENAYWLTQLRAFDRSNREFAEIPSYELIEGWTAEDVRRAAEKYLRMDQYAKFTRLPEAPVGDR